MNFKKFFADYQNDLDFCLFLQKLSKEVIINNQDKIDLMFDLDEIFYNNRLTVPKKQL